ncbi:MAG: hypothetical protein JXQ87_05275 [Bacteroidia bacterium]
MIFKITPAFILFIVLATSCSQAVKSELTNDEMHDSNTEQNEIEQHSFGGWYCPDNLFGLPAVNIQEWEKVPVVNGRLPTQEETKSGAALIFVDKDKFPDAKPLDVKMPKLARFKSPYTNRDEIIIVFQTVVVQQDTIVGYRYLNGGNGSSRYNEVNFLTETEINEIPESQFVQLRIQIKATPEQIWQVITSPIRNGQFIPIFEGDNDVKENWRDETNLNFTYSKSGNLTSDFANLLYGNYYIQNDYDNEYNYSEKFMISNSEEDSSTCELIISCGPFGKDYEQQLELITKWANRVKELSQGN